MIRSFRVLSDYRRFHCVLALVGALAFFAGVAQAGSYHLSPSDTDLGDLDHTYAYRWGINTPWNTGDDLVSATLTFKNIRDWTREPNQLWVDLLPSGTAGIRTYTDNEATGDYFASKSGRVLLNEYVNLSTQAQTLVYLFSPSELASLKSYASDGNFALAFDPDCHFYNDGICLDVCTKAPTPPGPSVPLPAAAWMFGPAAALALCASRRMRAAA